MIPTSLGQRETHQALVLGRRQDALRDEHVRGNSSATLTTAHTMKH